MARILDKIRGVVVDVLFPFDAFINKLECNQNLEYNFQIPNTNLVSSIIR